MTPTMTRPLVSVIVPIYNTEERLPACLDSLVNQTLQDIEIILVNDGSKDNSLKICLEYQKRFPQKINVITGENCGVCVARNKGLDAATGEWIAFCDSDDVVALDIYKTLYDNAIHDNADLSCCTFHDTHYAGIDIIVKPFPFSKSIIMNGQKQILNQVFMPLLRGANDVHGYLFVHLFKREFIEASHIRFIPGIAMMEDELFFLAYLLNIKCITAIDTPMYDYLNFEKSACATYYHNRSDYFRESNWYMRAREQHRIFQAGGLDSLYPGQLDEIIIREYFHEAQMHCCNPENGYFKALTLLKDCAQRAVKDGAKNNKNGKVFWIFLLHLRPLLPLLLWLKRTKDTLSAKVHHS